MVWKVNTKHKNTTMTFILIKHLILFSLTLTKYLGKMVLFSVASSKWKYLVLLIILLLPFLRVCVNTHLPSLLSVIAFTLTSSAERILLVPWIAFTWVNENINSEVQTGTFHNNEYKYLSPAAQKTQIPTELEARSISTETIPFPLLTRKMEMNTLRQNSELHWTGCFGEVSETTLALLAGVGPPGMLPSSPTLDVLQHHPQLTHSHSFLRLFNRGNCILDWTAHFCQSIH